MVVRLRLLFLRLNTGKVAVSITAVTIPVSLGNNGHGIGNFHRPLLLMQHLFLRSLGREVGGQHFFEEL